MTLASPPVRGPRQAPAGASFALQATGITKRFPGVLANDHVDFDLKHGEIHGLLGENGAGKTTLMNVLYGLYQPDEGTILLNGRPTRITSPHDAIAQGIGMVHQHFMLVPPLTVTENIILGQESLQPATQFLGRLSALDRRTAAHRILALSHQYSLDVDPDAYVKDLPVGARQRVEIVKALYRAADILILDEPTAVLTPQESDELFEIMTGMAVAGKSLVFITHKLREMLIVADRISVMRGGKMVGTTTPTEASSEMLAEMMVGRKVILQVDKEPPSPGTTVLTLQDLEVRDDRHLTTVNGVSLQVREGEILGIAGVQGNGQRELVEAITGLRPV
ncbi:MAG: ABC transporter ATP-binding protein, partial [Acidobacteriota bacterium]